MGGAPIPDARIRLGVDVLRTDASGRFSSTTTATFDEPASEFANGILSVDATGFCSFGAPIQVLEFPVVLRLPRGASVGGVVRDPEGQPMDGVRVAVSDRGSYQPLPTSGTPYADAPGGGRWSDATGDGALTDEEGRFEIDGLLPWWPGHSLWATAEGHESHSVELPEQVPGERREVEVVLTPRGSGTVHGVVRLNGRPTGGEVVHELTRDESRRTTAFLDASGAYRLEHLPPGPFQLEVRPTAKSITSLDPRARVELVLAAGQELRHDFDLEVPFSQIGGRVRYEDRRPAGHVKMHATCEGIHQRSVTDAEGRFRIFVPETTETYTVTAKEGPYETQRSGISAGQDDLELVLPSLGTLLVRVRDGRTGEQLARIPIAWRPAGQGEYASAMPGPPDEEGFSALRLPAGGVDLHARPWRTPRAPQLLENVLVRPQDEPERVTFDLEPGLEITLHLDPPGPLPNQTTILLVPAERWSTVGLRTNERGWVLPTYGGVAPDWNLEPLFRQGHDSSLRTLAAGTYRFKVFGADLELEPSTLELRESPAAPITIRWKAR